MVAFPCSRLAVAGAGGGVARDAADCAAAAAGFHSSSRVADKGPRMTIC
jgi:hypothetical protein